MDVGRDRTKLLCYKYAIGRGNVPNVERTKPIGQPIDK